MYRSLLTLKDSLEGRLKTNRTRQRHLIRTVRDRGERDISTMSVGTGDMNYQSIEEGEVVEGASFADSKEGSNYFLDPFSKEGFINIRIKPPLNTRGMKKMQFPTDVTVTISGPHRTTRQEQNLDYLHHKFSSYPSLMCVAV